MFSSTCATYGEPETVPISEDEPTAPVNAYGASKLAVDLMIRDECRAHGLAAASLRYFNVAGASGELGEDHEPETHLIPLVLQAAAGVREHITVFGTDYPTRDGTAVRDYIHIEDLGEAHLLALDTLERGRHRIFNLGTGDGYTVREVIEAARRVTGREIPVREEGRRPGDPPELVAANARARDGARLGAAARARRDDRRRLGLAPGAPAAATGTDGQQRRERGDGSRRAPRPAPARRRSPRSARARPRRARRRRRAIASKNASSSRSSRSASSPRPRGAREPGARVDPQQQRAVGGQPAGREQVERADLLDAERRGRRPGRRARSRRSGRAAPSCPAASSGSSCSATSCARAAA